MNDATKVLCIRHNKELPKMMKPPFPGEDGEFIYANVSQRAWTEWLEEQTKLINEYKINPLDMKSRKYLRAQCMNFLHNRKVEPLDMDKADD